MRPIWRAGLVACLAVLLIGAALAAANFPPLTGRVVDAAKILSPIAKADLEGKLSALEQKSGIQLVVATVPSLGGDEIEPYANALFRAWKLGEAKQNNGGPCRRCPPDPGRRSHAHRPALRGMERR